MRFLVALSVVLLCCQQAAAQSFSVETGTLDISGGAPPGDDILAPGPFPIIPGSGIGIDTDGFTYGRSFLGERVYFSADVLSLGTPPSAVATQVGFGGLGEQNADVYVSFGLGTNALYHDGDGIGPGPGTGGPLGLLEPAFPPLGRAVDGYDTRPIPGGAPFPSIYWTYHPAGFPSSPSPADVLLSPSVPGYSGIPIVFASEAALGLTLATTIGDDNVDALEVIDTDGVFGPGDAILFSLDGASASLFTAGSPLFGFGPEDIFITPFGGAPVLFMPGAAIGLVPGDNLTALSINIPEPGSASLMSLALISMVLVRRKRQCPA